MMYKKQGVALIWALVLSAILLIISATMVSYITQESRFSVRIAESATAYSYAKYGIEWANWHLDNEGSVPHSQAFDFDDSGTNEVEIEITLGDCNGGGDANYCIISTGIDNDVTRKIEHESYSKQEGVVNLYGTEPGDIQVTDNNNESFEMNFRFWGNHSTMFGLDTGIGDSSMDPDSTIPNRSYLAFRTEIDYDGRNDNIRLQARDISGNIYKSELLTDDSGIIDINTDINKREPYEYKVTIKYIEDTAASIRVCDGYTDDSNYTCRGGASIDLVGVDLGNLNHLFVYDSGSDDGYTDDTVEYEYRTGQTFINAGDGNIIVGEPVINVWSNDYWVIYDVITLNGVEVLAGESITFPVSSSIPTTPGTSITITDSGGTEIYRCSAGDVICSPIDVTLGEEITFNIIDTNDDYIFSEWSGGTCSGDSSCTITVSGIISGVTANFTEKWSSLSDFFYYYSDLPFSSKWADNSWEEDSCRDHSPVICNNSDTTIGDYAFLFDNMLNFEHFPARNECKMIGGRLPNVDELDLMFSNDILSGRYWSSEESSNRRSYTVGNGSEVREEEKHREFSIRCVKD